MIRSIEIKNLRGIREGKLDDLTPLVILVGPNGSGKSSVLDALLIGGSPNATQGVHLSTARNACLARTPRWLLWMSGGQGPSKTTVYTQGGNPRACELSLGGKPATPKFVFRVAQPGSAPSPAAKQTAHIMLAPGNRWVGEEPRVPLSDLPSVDIVAAYSPEESLPLHQIYSKVVQLGLREKTNEIIRDVVPGMTHMEILTEGDTPVMNFVFEEYSLPAELAGDGVHALLRTCLELASRPGGVVLLEEPEVHLHPGAIRKSAKAILAAVRREIQVILTTHSLEFIDALVAEASDEDLEKLSLYRTQLDDGVLKSSRLPGPDVAFSRTEIKDDLR